MQQRMKIQANEHELATMRTEDLTSATGGGFWDRALAVADHDSMVGTRVGNRIGDRLGLASGQSGDNILGEIGGAAGLMWGALQGETTALVHPSVGDALLKRWGGDEGIKAPHR